MNGKGNILEPLLNETSKIRREAAKRRNPYDYVSISKSEVDAYVANGWSIEKELKQKTRLKRQRPIDVWLENRVWMLFHRMGYHELNAGRNFAILVDRKNSDPEKKQIDVFAKDDETVIVAECKASENMKNRSLQKDIEEFANLKGYLANSIKDYYGHDFRPKIIWLFVTQNIIWSKPDKERAKGENIRIITERELPYYLQIADHLKRAARFQFLAEFLKGQKIPGLQNQKVPAIRGTLGGHKFYSFVASPKHLLKLAFVNHRSLDDPEGAPAYQRLVSRARMKQIGKFLLDGGFFPTNILVNFMQKVRFEVVAKDETANVTFGNLFLPDSYRSMWIIDGQHRLYGFAQLEEKYQMQNMAIIAFEKISHEEEAELFVTINHEQKSVPKTLLDDLEGELKWESDVPSERIGAISARLIGILNFDTDEPFFGRVTQQGIAATDKTCLTVPALKEGLRRSGLVGRAIFKGAEYSPGPLCGVSDRDTLDRARSALNLYFGQIRASNYIFWDKGRESHLCTNVSIQAYLQLFADIIEYMQPNKGLNARELTPEELIQETEEYLDPILKWLQSASAADLEKDFKVQFGSGGPREYYFRLCRIVKSHFSDFKPEGLEKWEQEQSSEKIEMADHKIKELNKMVQKYIFNTFKKLYGEENDAYFEKGILDKNIKTNAYKKSLDDEDSRLPKENYLDFIEFKQIIENKTHWPKFKPVFDIREPGAEKGHAKNIRWMDRINELRRISAHASESRTYKLEDFEYIEFIYEEFTKNLEAAKETPAV
jgi:DGQHR domain-containing protein